MHSGFRTLPPTASIETLAMSLLTPNDFAAGASLAGTPTFDARAMTGTDGIARIVLDDKVYTLRITRAEKLILTK
jgi:hemin uptake protein HemP